MFCQVCYGMVLDLWSGSGAVCRCMVWLCEVEPGRGWCGGVWLGMVIFTIDELPGLKFPWFGRMPLYLWRPLKQWVYQRDNGVCQYCNTETLYEKTHCHHVLELSENGTNHPSNLKTLCHQCHKVRHPFMLSTREKLRQGVGFP